MAKAKQNPDKFTWKKGDVEILTPAQAEKAVKSGKIKKPAGKPGKRT